MVRTGLGAQRLDPTQALNLVHRTPHRPQALGRHSSALKSYERALELDAARPYSLAQAGALLYAGARYADAADRRARPAAGAVGPVGEWGIVLPNSSLATAHAAGGRARWTNVPLSCLAHAAFASPHTLPPPPHSPHSRPLPCRYRSALQLQPGFAAAQLGLAETLLAAARQHARMGAAGAAAAELREAAQQASACARRGSGSQMVTAWKLLGDVLMQHARVPPGAATPAPAGGGGRADERAAAEDAADAARRALGTRLVAMRAARRAYLRAAHLEPSSGLLWGDLAGSCHQEAALLRLQDAGGAGGGAEGGQGAGSLAAAAAARAERLAKAGLLLAPTDPWLWRQLGAVAAAPATSEYAFSRCGVHDRGARRSSAGAASRRLRRLRHRCSSGFSGPRAGPALRGAPSSLRTDTCLSSLPPPAVS